MSFLQQPVDGITEAVLDNLILSGVSESKFIEYKKALPGPTDSDKKEFLYDLSSLANAQGGDILFGVEAVKGVPKSIPGLAKQDIDAQILRCDQVAQVGISPRIPGLRFHPIQLTNGRCVLLARIPKTWAGPHMVVFQDTNKFYSRNSAGKYLLDVEELRSAFLAETTIGEKIRSFRLDRINAILTGDLSVELTNRPKVVLHVLPVVSFRSGFQVDLQSITASDPNLTMPMPNIGFDRHFNYNGLLTFARLEGYAHNYLQLFRTGCLEMVSTLEAWEGKTFAIDVLESVLVTCGERLCILLKTMQVPGPFVILLTCLGTKEYSLKTEGRRWQHGSHSIERDNLFFDEVVLHDADQDFGRSMRPIFNQLWNACGWPASLNYDAKGKWGVHH